MNFYADLIAAIALVLVFEGILPFIKPQRWRGMMTLLSNQSDVSLRVMGLSSMLVGLVILYAVR